jgi:hypothetical protein
LVEDARAWRDPTAAGQSALAVGGTAAGMPTGDTTIITVMPARYRAIWMMVRGAR